MFTYTAKNYLPERGQIVPYGEREDITFSCRLKKMHCEGLKANGKRCGRNTIRAHPYCWQHYQKINKVIIAKSHVPDAGMGLYACDYTQPKGAIVFRKGDLICQYGGEHLTKSQLDTRYGSGGQVAPYTWQHPVSQEFYDSACKRWIGSFSNDPKGLIPKTQSNAQIKYAEPSASSRERINQLRYEPLPNMVAGLYAKNNIMNGQEIYVSYGKDWWAGVAPRFKVTVHTRRVSAKSQKCRAK